MELTRQERQILLYYLNIFLFEAQFDYSKECDLAVVSLNGRSMFMDKQRIKELKRIVKKVEGEW